MPALKWSGPKIRAHSHRRLPPFKSAFHHQKLQEDVSISARTRRTLAPSDQIGEC
jgi:hypothetical protein